VLFPGDGGRHSKHVGGKSYVHFKFFVPPIKCVYVVCTILVVIGIIFNQY